MLYITVAASLNYINQKMMGALKDSDNSTPSQNALKLKLHIVFEVTAR